MKRTLKLRLIFSIFFLNVAALISVYLTHQFSLNVYAATSVSVNEFQIPTQESYTSELTSDLQGNIWFTEESVNKIGKIFKSGSITEFELPYPSQPHDIVSDSNNTIWFTEIAANSIGRILPDGTISRFVLPNHNSYPHKITKGSDGNIWFTEYWGNRIGKITASGEITEYPIPTADSFPYGITKGSDGNLWFTEENGQKIARMSLNGDVTEYHIPHVGSTASAITSGPDGNLWFIEKNYNNYNPGIGRITLDGVITEYYGILLQPYDISLGPDNKVWFTESLGNKIGSITTDGTITEFSVPEADNRGITIDPYGDLWYAETSVNKIAHFDTSNVVPTLTITPTKTPPSTGGVLDVPYFSQNVAPWGASEYDHTKSLGVTGYQTTMDRWGCAVASIAMVLNYHNMKQFADGKVIDPGSLNEWLKNNNGYDYGYNKKGWYSSIKWWEIGTLTAQLYRAGKAPYKLEWKKAYQSTQTNALITQDLTVGNELSKIPSVIFVTNKETTGHYVVAKGILSNTFAINDPEWNHSNLTSFNSTYKDVHRYVPSKTDLSYITAVVNPNIEILITDSQGRRTGKNVDNGIVEVFDEIPGASYTFEPPIMNPKEDRSIETLGTGVNQLLLPNPDNGNYLITISSLDNDTYTLNTSMLEIDGDSTHDKSIGILSPSIQNSFVISYSQTGPSITNKEITFDILKTDIKNLYKQGQIKNKLVYNILKLQAELAERASLVNRQPLGNKLAVLALKTFQYELKKVRDQSVTEDAYQILYKDADVIIKFLQGDSGTPTPTPESGGS